MKDADAGAAGLDDWLGRQSPDYLQGVDRVKRDLVLEASALAIRLQNWKQNPDGASPRVWAEAVENMRDAADLLVLLVDQLTIVRTLAAEHRRVAREANVALERIFERAEQQQNKCSARRTASDEAADKS